MTALTLPQACHLARRTGFSALPAQVEALMTFADQQDAIDGLLHQPGSEHSLPDWHDLPPPGRTDDMETRQQRQQQRNRMGSDLKYWWFEQMHRNSAPLQEKMTLFWANHFTSSLKKVKWPPALLAQNRTLRANSLGSFRTLLDAMIKDPAMLIYLDNTNSKKHAPNENLARELLELFSMGEGQYSEQDIKELARALTGAAVNQSTGLYQFRRWAHDAGRKTIFGETARFAPDDLADLILRQPQVAPFITNKIWQFLVGTAPEAQDLSTLSQGFRDSNYDIAALVKQILNHAAFWQSAGQIIKSPMELLVGSYQLFGFATPRQRQLLQALKSMGQDLFDPPNVKGWPEGNAWYTSANLAMRERVVGYVVAHAEQQPPLTFVLATDPVGNLPSPESPRYLSAMLFDPAYQVV